MKKDIFWSDWLDGNERDESAHDLQSLFQRAEKFLKNSDMFEFVNELKSIEGVIQIEALYSFTNQFNNLLEQGVKVAILKKDSATLCKLASLTQKKEILISVFKGMLQTDALKEAISFCALYQPESTNSGRISFDAWELLVSALIDAKFYKEAVALLRFVQSSYYQRSNAEYIIRQLDITRDFELWFGLLRFVFHQLPYDSNQQHALEKTIQYLLKIKNETNKVIKCITMINQTDVQTRFWQLLMLHLLAEESFTSADILVNHIPYSLKTTIRSIQLCFNSLEKCDVLDQLEEGQYKLLEPTIVKRFVARHGNDDTNVTLSIINQHHQTLKNYGNSFIQAVALGLCAVMRDDFTRALFNQYHFLITLPATFSTREEIEQHPFVPSLLEQYHHSGLKRYEDILSTLPITIISKTNKTQISINIKDLIPENILKEATQSYIQSFITELNEIFTPIKNQMLYPLHELYEKWCQFFDKLIEHGELKLALLHVQKLRRKNYQTPHVQVLLSHVLESEQYDLLQPLLAEIVEKKIRDACKKFRAAVMRVDTTPLKYLVALVQIASSTQFIISVDMLKQTVIKCWNIESGITQALNQLFASQVYKLHRKSRIENAAFDWLNDFLASRITICYGSDSSTLIKKMNDWELTINDPLWLKIILHCVGNEALHDSAAQLAVIIINTMFFQDSFREGIEDILSHLPPDQCSNLLHKISDSLTKKDFVNFPLICNALGSKKLRDHTKASIEFVCALPLESVKNELLIKAFFETLLSEYSDFNFQCFLALKTIPQYQTLKTVYYLITENKLSECILLLATNTALMTLNHLKYHSYQLKDEILSQCASDINCLNGLLPVINTLIEYCHPIDYDLDKAKTRHLETFTWLKQAMQTAFSHVNNLENCETLFDLYINNFDLFKTRNEPQLFSSAWSAVATLAQEGKLKLPKELALKLINLNTFYSSNHLPKLIESFLHHDAVSYSKFLVQSAKAASGKYRYHEFVTSTNKIADYFFQRKRFVAMKNWLINDVALSILETKLLHWIVKCVSADEILIAKELFSHLKTKKLTRNEKHFVRDFISLRAITLTTELLHALSYHEKLSISECIKYEEEIDNLFFDLLREFIPRDYVNKLQLYLKTTVPNILKITSENFDMQFRERRNGIIVELRSLLDKAFLYFCRTSNPEKNYKQAYFPVVPEIPEEKTLEEQLTLFCKKFLKEPEFSDHHPALFKFFLYIQPLENADFIWLSQLYPLANIQKHVKDLIRTPELNEIPIKMQQFLPKVTRGIIFILINLFSTDQPTLAKSLTEYMALRYPGDPFKESIFTLLASMQDIDTEQKRIYTQLQATLYNPTFNTLSKEQLNSNTSSKIEKRYFQKK